MVGGRLASYKKGERRRVTSESAVLKRARANDEEALGELYDLYAPRIYGYIFRRVQDAQVAEDLTGEVFVRVLQAIRSEQFWHTSFRAWLYRIAHNLVVDHYRRRPPTPALALDERLVAASDDLDSALADTLSRQRLQAAIGRLTPDQQQVLVLRFGEQLSARDVAEIVGKSVGAVEALQHRAIATLRRILEED
jgi:RNA polymerase sigma-70 factor (ECF subfamily)